MVRITALGLLDKQLLFSLIKGRVTKSSRISREVSQPNLHLSLMLTLTKRTNRFVPKHRQWHSIESKCYWVQRRLFKPYKSHL